MAIKKIRMRPEGTNDYVDVLHPETSADVVVGLNKSFINLGSVDNVKQLPINGGTLTGITKAHNNTSYTIPQLRNVSSGTGEPTGGNHGDIYLRRG